MNKSEEAWKIVRACFGASGVWADPTRYRWQCWTRDFALAIQPLLLKHNQRDIARRHLLNLSRRVRANGQVPILYLDSHLGFLVDKVRRTLQSKPRGMSFMLRRYLQGQLWNLTPGTKDSEILYLFAMEEYAEATGDHSLVEAFSAEMERVMAYVHEHLEVDGLVHGADWRDTMHVELADKPLLTNNSAWYAALERSGHSEQAELVRSRILESHLTDGLLDDYPGRHRFDPLGAALAVLHGVVRPEHYPMVVRGFRSVDSPYGVTIHCRHSPLDAEEAAVIERTDGQVVWPFIVGFSILALRKMGDPMAAEQFDKLSRHAGFREWYDPATGKGYGAREQLWSATLYLRACDAML